MILKECMLIKNDCYRHDEKITDAKPVGIVVHSTGANNKTLKRYVQPVPEQSYYSEVINDLGKNIYGNHWNKASYQKCVHAFIGTNEKGTVETYQTLPFDICCWGVGRGSKGSYNYNPTAHIQFEICEDNLKDAQYFEAVMQEAQEFCAHLCKQFGLSVDTIVGHNEAYKAGYGSNHSDPEHWMKKFGKDMKWFRAEVKKLLEAKETKVLYCVQVGAFKSERNANNLAAKLKKKGFATYVVYIDGFYKVQVGAYSKKSNAEAMLAKLKAAGYNGIIKEKNK